MRKVLLVAGLLCLAGSARAQSPFYEVAKGSAIVANLPIVATAVQVDVSTRSIIMPGGKRRSTIEIWNDSSANNLFCGFSPLVSATATEDNYGRRIEPRSSWQLAIPPEVLVYCISDLATGLRTVITQLY